MILFRILRSIRNFKAKLFLVFLLVHSSFCSKIRCFLKLGEIADNRWCYAKSRCVENGNRCQMRVLRAIFSRNDGRMYSVVNCKEGLFRDFPHILGPIMASPLQADRTKIKNKQQRECNNHQM